MKPKRKDPPKKGRPDTVAQPFTKERYAALFANVLERMTGEDCIVIPKSFAVFYVQRLSGDRWIQV